MIIRTFQRRSVQLPAWSFPVVLAICLGLLYGGQLSASYSAANNGADGGDLLAAVLTGGVPHPTGYPTYLLAGALFQKLPLDDQVTPYTKGALLSLVCTVLAACLAPYAIRRAAAAEQRSREPGSVEQSAQSPAGLVGLAAAGLAIGLAPACWSQAVIVEVYGLQAFFTACCLFWIERILRGGRRLHSLEPGSPEPRFVTTPHDKGLVALSILIGLGIGNHLSILLLFPALGIAAFIALRGGMPTRRLLKYAALAGGAGALVYTALPVRALDYPPVNWGNPQTLPGFLWLVTGQVYHELAFALPAAQILPRISYLAGWLLHQFGVVGVLLGLLGAALTFTEQQPARWAHIWIFGASAVFSIGYLTNDSIVYLAPAAMVFALWIGAVVDRLWSGSLSGFSHQTAGRLLVGVFFLSMVIGLPAAYREVDPRSETAARVFAESCLAGLPKGALVVTHTDQDTFPLWYYHYGLGQQPGAGLVVQGLAGFDWYAETLRHANPPIALPEGGAENWEAELARLNPGRPVCRCDLALPGSAPAVSCTGE